MPLAVPSTLFDEITNFLASGPSSEVILDYRPSDALDERLHELLEKNSRDEITLEEREELDEFLRMNHLLTMIQAKARLLFYSSETH